MCDSSNAIEIVAEMLTYLKQADFAIREELVINLLRIITIHRQFGVTTFSLLIFLNSFFTIYLLPFYYFCSSNLVRYSIEIPYVMDLQLLFFDAVKQICNIFIVV